MNEIPSGPIYINDSPSLAPEYPGMAQSEYTSKMMAWRESAREEATSLAYMNPEKDAAAHYLRALQGEYWDKKRARYKSRFFDNRLDNARRSDLALLTDTRPTIDISSPIPAYQQAADTVSKIIHYEWFKRDMDLALTMVADISHLNGTGFWKIGSAPPGALQVIPCGPESVLPIQPVGHDIQSSQAVLYRTWKNLSYFRSKFPYGSADLDKEVSFTEQGVGGETRFNRPSDIPEYVWNGLSPAIRRAVGLRSTENVEVQTSPFKSIELQEYYIDDRSTNMSTRDVLMRHPYVSIQNHNFWYVVKPGQRLYPRKRLVVFAGRRLMYDGPAPNWHGLYPFACLRLNPVPWSFWGLSKYRDLLPLNHAMNEIGAGIMDMIRRALNPTAITKAGAVPPASFKEFYPDMPGGRLYMLPNANIATDLRYMDPPNIPPWVLQWHQYVSSEFDRLSGGLDMSSLGKKKQAPGAETIEQMKDSQSSGQRLEGRYMEAFLRDAGIQAMSNVFQNYELPLRLRILGKDGDTFEDYETPLGSMIPGHIMNKEDHWRSFAMSVTPGSLLSNSQDRDKQIAITLAAKQLIPLTMLYDKLQMGNPEAILKKLKEEHDLGLNAGHSAGRQPRSASEKNKAA